MSEHKNDSIIEKYRQVVTQAEDLVVGAQGENLIGVRNDGVFDPIGIGRIGTAIGLEVIDADDPTGNAISFN